MAEWAYYNRVAWLPFLDSAAGATRNSQFFGHTCMVGSFCIQIYYEDLLNDRANKLTVGAERISKLMFLI
jgi:hypothetical protein